MQILRRGYSSIQTSRQRHSAARKAATVRCFCYSDPRLAFRLRNIKFRAAAMNSRARQKPACLPAYPEQQFPSRCLSSGSLEVAKSFVAPELCIVHCSDSLDRSRDASKYQKNCRRKEFHSRGFIPADTDFERPPTHNGRNLLRKFPMQLFGAEELLQALSRAVGRSNCFTLSLASDFFFCFFASGLSREMAAGLAGRQAGRLQTKFRELFPGASVPSRVFASLSFLVPLLEIFI